MTASRPPHLSSASSDLAPMRLLAGGGSAREQLLLESADLDVMPQAEALRLARALALPPKGGPSGVPAPVRLPLRSSHWLLLGGIGALAVVGFAVARLTSVAPVAAPDAPAIPPASVVARASVVAPVVPAVAAVRGASPEASDVTRPAPRREASAVGANAISSRPRAVPARPRASRAGAGLLEEARLLEKARGALRAGQTDVAERTLADYHSRFARGELTLEGQLLDVDLLLARGEDQGALSLAHQLASRGDAARYRPRLEAQMQRARANRSTPGAPPPGTSPLFDGSERGPSHMDPSRKP